MGYSKLGENRVAFIDLLRAIAILGVVMCHVVVGKIYDFNAEYINGISGWESFFAFFVFTLGRLGVPFFLMISGYLLLDREYDEKAYKRILRNTCLRLLIVTEIWLIIYNIYGYIMNAAPFSWVDIGCQLLFLRLGVQNQFSHVWYMPMIIGMYLTIPLAANALRSVEYKLLRIPYLILWVLSFGIATANAVLITSGKSLGSSFISQGFSGGVYGLYLVMEHFQKKGALKNIRTAWLSLTVILSFAGAMWTQLYAHAHGVTYNIWYDNAFLFIAAVGIFELISRSRRNYSKFIQLLSKYSFPMYLVHMLLIDLCKRVEAWMNFPRPVLVMLIWGISVLGSMLVCAGISRIPKVGKYILYMK